MIKRIAILSLTLAALFSLSCDLGGGVKDKDDEDPADEEQTEEPAPESPGSTVWYSYDQNKYGFALVRHSLSYDSDSFEELDQYWTGTEWKLYMGLRGTLASASGTTHTATLTAVNYRDGSEQRWFASGTDTFNFLLPYVWSAADKTAAKVDYALSGSTLTYRRDQNDDGATSGAADQNLDMTTSATTTLPGAGTYPDLQYQSLHFHGNYDRLYATTEFGSVAQDIGSATVSDIKLTVSCKADGSLASTTEPALTELSLTARQDPDDGEWEWYCGDATDEYHEFTGPAEGGIWWVSELQVSFADGSSAVYNADSPYEPYTGSYTTNTGYIGTCSTAHLPAQDYRPPDDPPSGHGMYYIETVPNGSSQEGDGFDTRIFLYKEDDLTHWIASNDDGHGAILSGGDYIDGLYSELAVPLEQGARYFLKVVDLNDRPGYYSVRINDNPADLETGISAETPSSPDDYEDDDSDTSADEADALPVDGSFQDRSYESGDPDWIIIDVPPAT